MHTPNPVAEKRYPGNLSQECFNELVLHHAVIKIAYEERLEYLKVILAIPLPQKYDNNYFLWMTGLET